ncbi:MAG: hypothetical protein A2731_01975 [Candidatus Buchananbacteria bacterium RIFCSPHIGHO2_01_FULL_39_8]|uniref:Uncharacterized protein n=1 Tax=Candidatus Buchananbacteria bacterium RIFCSPHIGHO2_01_FULL_39_8 TaxID=1797533 RepID=A0A1G1Y0P3_9BACT|nr:MAG: hypothetical protein A2731_01975 [Candidatus Buchananbacteria bacterium RIFCSPHIGHO2_01_FULL_39_8]
MSRFLSNSSIFLRVGSDNALKVLFKVIFPYLLGLWQYVIRYLDNYLNINLIKKLCQPLTYFTKTLLSIYQVFREISRYIYNIFVVK